MVIKAEAPLRACSWLQVRSGAALGVRCGRIVSALLPAAELLLRGVMDLRHKYWQQASPSAITVRDAIEQARRTSTQGPKCIREPYSKDCRRMFLTYPQRRSVLLGSLPLCALLCAPPECQQWLAWSARY